MWKSPKSRSRDNDDDGIDYGVIGRNSECFRSKSETKWKDVRLVILVSLCCIFCTVSLVQALKIARLESEIDEITKDIIQLEKEIRDLKTNFGNQNRILKNDKIRSFPSQFNSFESQF